jgi:hypothetical protein
MLGSSLFARQLGWLRSEGVKFPIQDLITVDLTDLGTQRDYENNHRSQKLPPHRHSSPGPADYEAEQRFR